MTVVALALIVSVYAVAILGTFQGGTVSVGGVSAGTISYSTDNAAGGTWTATLQVSSATDPWYAKIAVSGYTGPVTVTWQLQVQTAPSTWTNVNGATLTTTTSLTGAPQAIYASADGSIGANQNWGSDCSTNGTYIITVTVDSA